MKTAVITGTTRGLGLAMATKFEEFGWNIVRLNRPEFDLCNLDTAAISDRFSKIQGGGRVVLVNNAATHHIEPICYLSHDRIEQEVSTNIVGPISLISAFLRLFPDGEVANITSAAATEPHRDWSLYGTAKAAMNAFIGHLDAEGVKTFNLNPGAVTTDMQMRIAKSSSPLAPGTKLRDVNVVAKALVWQVDRG